MKVIDKVRAGAARPQGMCVADIDANPGSVASAIRYLSDHGQVFIAKISHKKTRYYDTRERADACVASTRRPKASGWGVKIQGRPRFDPDAPMIFTKDTKYTYAPPPPPCLHTNTHGQHG